MPTVSIGETIVLSPENEPLSVSLYTVDRLLKETDFDSLIALYIFLYRHTRRQRTSSVWCTPKYIAKGLSWSESKVQRVKKRLKELGFISFKQTYNNNGSFAKQYIQVNFVYSPNPANADDSYGLASHDPPPVQNHRSGEFDTPKCLLNSKHINASTHTPVCEESENSVQQQSSESSPASEDTDFHELPVRERVDVVYKYYRAKAQELHPDVKFNELQDKKQLDFYLRAHLQYQGEYTTDIDAFLAQDLSWMQMPNPYSVKMFVSWIDKGKPPWNNFQKGKKPHNTVPSLSTMTEEERKAYYKKDAHKFQRSIGG